MKRLVAAVAIAAVIVAAVLLIAPIKDHIDRQSHPIKYSEYVEKYAEEFGVPQQFIYAVIRTESSFDPEAVSSIGARGLMQITEVAFDWIEMRSSFGASYDDMFDPETNIRYGTYMLKLLIEQFGSESNALCAYHAGWGAAQNWLSDKEVTPDGENIENIPYPDTAWYVDTVLKARDTYNRLYFSEGE